MKMWLEQRFKRDKLFPGTLYDFKKWLGHQEPETLNFAELMELVPLMDSLGGGPWHGVDGKNFIFRWRFKNHGKYWKRHELFSGHGETLDSAALSGLLVCWELLTFRKSHGGK